MKADEKALFDTNAQSAATRQRILEFHSKWEGPGKHPNPEAAKEVAQAFLAYGDLLSRRAYLSLKNTLLHATGGFQMTGEPVSDAEWFLSGKWNTGVGRDLRTEVPVMHAVPDAQGPLQVAVSLPGQEEITLCRTPEGNMVAVRSNSQVIATVGPGSPHSDLPAARKWLTDQAEEWRRNNFPFTAEHWLLITDNLEDREGEIDRRQPSGQVAAEGEDKAVVHPGHYNQVPGIECMDVVKHFDFCTGNAIKYLWRAGSKDPKKTVEDLRKAIYYTNIRIMDIEAQEGK